MLHFQFPVQTQLSARNSGNKYGHNKRRKITAVLKVDFFTDNSSAPAAIITGVLPNRRSSPSASNNLSPIKIGYELTKLSPPKSDLGCIELMTNVGFPLLWVQLIMAAIQACLPFVNSAKAIIKINIIKVYLRIIH